MVQKHFISIFLIFIFYSNNLYTKSFITLPFTYINKKANNSNPLEETPKDYFESFLDNTLYTTLKINNQDIKFHLTTERYTTYISDKTMNKNLKENNNNKNLYSLDYIGIYKAEFTNAQFQFALNNSKNIEENILYFNIKQMYVQNDSDTSRISSYASENNEIGFNIHKGNAFQSVTVGNDDYTEDFYEDIFDFDDNKTESNKTKKKEKDPDALLKNGGYNVEEDTNLIKQLKKNKIINSYSFLIKYNNKNDENGQIIIGGLPHEYDPKHYSEDYFIDDYVNIDPNRNTTIWCTFFSKMTYDNESFADQYQYYRYSIFSLDFGFISASSNFREYFDKKFFNNYKEFCNYEIINKYYFYHCKENAVKNFKKVVFYLYNKLPNHKIEFDYNDLFIQSKKDPSIYYFQIIFKNSTNRWVLGRPLFKKYPTVFDQDKKKFGFYLQTGEYEVNDGNKENNSNIPWSWILVIVLSIIVIVLGVILYKTIPLIRRKKKANELDEDFVYESQNDKNENNKIIND